MQLFRFYVAMLFVSILIYTVIVSLDHGTSFMPLFFGEVAAMTWFGQFNTDFMMYLGMSSVWVAWRHTFSPPGLLLAFFALIGGALFFTPYLFIAASKSNGDAAVLLLGPKRAAKRISE